MACFVICVFELIRFLSDLARKTFNRSNKMSGEAKRMSLTKELLPSEGPRQENTISSH